MSVTLASAIAIFLVLLILYKKQIFLPPAGALAILAMLVPDEMLLVYPLHAFLGVSAYMLFAVFVLKWIGKARMNLVDMKRQEA